MTRRFSLLLLFAVGCSASAPVPTPPATPVSSAPVSLKLAGIHNAFRVSDRIVSGSSPEGDEAFEALRERGVKTIISVDGAAPDVERAKRHGIRYVHIPIGYDGVPPEKSLLLVKAARDLPGPIYVHCHHGKHRGPAAVAVMVLCTDPKWTPEFAAEWLKVAGIDPRYRGLVGIPKTLVRPTSDELDKVPGTFPERVEVASITKAMVEIDERWERLKLVSAAKWAVPKDHPDIVPAHEALQVAEHYREIARRPEAKKRGEAFLTLVRDAETAALVLESALRASPVNAEKAAASFAKSAALCTSCHRQFRD